MDKESAKEKVAKLLAFATDGRGNEFEAEAAMRQAEKMMRAHGIEAAEIQARTGGKPVFAWTSVSVPAGAPVPVIDAPLWFGFMVTGIGKFTDCKVEYSRHAEHGMCAKFSGDEMDVAYAVYLAKHLRDECRRQAERFIGSLAERESFRKAMAIRLYERMLALRKERDVAYAAAPTSTGTALVVVNQKLALRDEQFGAQKTGKTRSVNFTNRTALDAGRKAGDNASLNRPLGGQQKQIRSA